MSIRRRTILAAGVAFVTVACWRDSTEETAEGSVSRSWNPTEVEDVRGVPIVAFRAELERQLGQRPRSATDEQWEHAKRLYKGYQNSPLWLDDDGLIKKRADDLVDALVNATGDGIDIDQYPLIDLARGLDSLRRTKEPNAEELARVDLLLTQSYVGLGEDYLTGQVPPRSVGQSWHIDPEEEAVDSALSRSLRESNIADAITRMRPQDYDYEMLRRKLADYRKVAASGGWSPIPGGDALKRGERAEPARLNALRARLQKEGIDVSASNASAGVYDQALAGAVAEFQRRHAIVVDSQLGKETLDAMNVPATFRLSQIAANLERYRWMPRTFGAKHIRVNVPAFRLEGFEDGKKTIEMKVIVGAEYEGRATPVFSDKMEYVIFRPYWDVPPSIAANEFTDGIPSDFDVSTRNGQVHLRQRPGPKNALGLVKFMFPNDFNIYLHDTPNDNLFEKDVRAFSHGCIRLEKPEELAQWVLGWDAERVREAMQNGRNDRTVRLPSKIPVYIAYFTTYMRDGRLWYGNDLYGRDTELARAVMGGAMPSGTAVQAVAALRKLTD